MVPTSYPAFVLKVSSHIVGVPSWDILLPFHNGKGNLALGTFSHLEKVIIISNLVN